MNILGMAQQGLSQAGSQVEKSAQRIAQASVDDSPTADSVSLSDGMGSLLQSKNQFEADLALARTANDIQKKTLELLA